MEKYRVVVKGIVKSEDNYLIVKRWYDDRIDEPYQWEFIDSSLNFGEAPDYAVIRLIKEKLGMDALINRIMYTWTYMVGDVFHVGICYECMGNDQDIILSEDLHDYKWIKLDEMNKYIENKNMLEDILRSEV